MTVHNSPYASQYIRLQRFITLLQLHNNNHANNPIHPIISRPKGQSSGVNITKINVACEKKTTNKPTCKYIYLR